MKIFYFKNVICLSLFCFIITSGYAQVVRKTGIGRVTQNEDITGRQAQQLAREKAKQNALEQLGSFSIQEIKKWGYATKNFSDGVMVQFADEFRIGRFKLLDEKVSNFIENGKQVYIVRATYEIDERDTKQQLQQYFELLLNDKFNQQIKKVDEAFQKLSNPNISALEFSKIQREFREVKGKLNSAYIDRSIISEADDDVNHKRFKVREYIRILDNYLAQGFVIPYLKGIDDIRHTNIQEDDYDLEITFSFELEQNDRIDEHYDKVLSVVSDDILPFYNSEMEKLAKKYPQYSLAENRFRGFDRYSDRDRVTGENIGKSAFSKMEKHNGIYLLGTAIITFSIKKTSNNKDIKKVKYYVGGYKSHHTAYELFPNTFGIKQLKIVVKKSQLGNEGDFPIGYAEK